MKRVIGFFLLMSLVFFSSPSPATDTIPRSYAKKELKVYILDNGYLECDANWMVSGTVVGTRQNKNPQTKWIKIPTYAVLVVHPEGNILFDLGTHPDTNEKYPGAAELFPYYHDSKQLFESQLKLAGVKPTDISTVVLSHLHFDHCGNLHLFDHAEIYLHPTELAANPEIEIKKPHPVDKDFEILPGIEVITLPGHTAGLLGLVVHLMEDGTLIFPADAVYTSANYGPPPRASGIVYDSLSYFKSIEKIHNLEKKHKAKVMFAHDMPFFEKIKKAPEYYK
jgi:glyoxylase-like metal-dependent hydrolase (beta-lactamase superfamily II)